MYLCGFTINVLTLWLLCWQQDGGRRRDSMTENIYKKMEQGINKWQAARDGSKEIYFAVIATSITLAVVFLLLYSAGICGDGFSVNSELS
jgi:multidrug efflux pump